MTGRTSSTDVTVIIPTHNRLAYLKEAVAAVVAQGPAVAEVIVVDDCSSDGTEQWLADAIAKESSAPAASLRWRTVRHSPARERAEARNAGLAMCETSFVLFLDDDDVLRPGALATLAAALARHPEAAGAAGAYRRFGALKEPGRDLHPRLPMTVQVWREELIGWNMPPSALLWRTDVVRAIGGFESALEHCEDRHLNLRAYPRPFVLVPQVVVDYRVHDRPPAPRVPDVESVVRHQFVASLPPAERPGAEAIVEARAHLAAGLELYVAGDFRAAAPHMVTIVRLAPALCRSPVLGPWLLGLIAKVLIGAALPHGAAVAIQGRVRRRRTARQMSPEHDTMV